MRNVLRTFRVDQQRELAAVIVGQTDTVDGQRRVFAQQRRSKEERTTHAFERSTTHPATVLRITHIAQPLEIHWVVERMDMPESTLKQVLVCLDPVLPRHARVRAELVVRIDYLKHVVCPSGSACGRQDQRPNDANYFFHYIKLLVMILPGCSVARLLPATDFLQR